MLDRLARLDESFPLKGTFIYTCTLTSDTNVYIGKSSKHDEVERIFFLYMYCIVLHIVIYLYIG